MSETKDGRLGADVRREVFLVFRERVHNSARHSGCTRVEVDFRLDGGWLTLSVKDNGRASTLRAS